MKITISAIVFCCIVMLGFAQAPIGARPEGQPMPEGQLSGKIVDDLGAPLSQVSVLLLKRVSETKTSGDTDLLLQSSISGKDGGFTFKGVPVREKLILRISSIGYGSVELPVVYDMPRPDSSAAKEVAKRPDPTMIAKLTAALNKDVGTVSLFPDATELDAVTVTARKALLEVDIDKKVFNVEKNIVSVGGTAIDVFRTMPSVQVDIDGNVKLRNASPTIFVDGRPTTLTPDQIPADMIEKVEIITNPSAKYDASGSMAGILNIILKKNKRTGYNGMLNLGADRLGGTNLMGSLNARQNKFNISLMGMNMRVRNFTDGNSSRASSINDIDALVDQDIEGKTRGAMTFGRLGIDYDMSDRTTLTLAGFVGGGRFKPEEDIRIFNTIAGTTSVSDRLANTDRSFKPRGLQAGLIQKFATEGEELTADFNYFGGKNELFGLYTTNYLNTAGETTGTQVQQNIGSGNNKFITVQVDYVKPFKNGMKLETGLRAQINELSNINDNLLKGVGETEFQNISSASSNFNSESSVYAAYASLDGSFAKLFSYKVGMRVESSDYEGTLLNTGEMFSNRFPLNLFPSLFLSKKLSDQDQLQISATRRVERPNFFQLIPFVDYTDSLNITRGNPDLVPEFTTSGELSYSRTGNKGVFLASLYYKHTNNLITRFLAQETNPVTGNLDFINTYINASSSQNYGAELTYTTNLKKWWDLTADLNLYNSRIDIVGETLQNPLWTVFGKMNNNFTLQKQWSVQLTFEYQGKTNMPVTQQQQFGPPSQAQSSSQGFIRPFYGLDMAVKKNFLKNDMASVTLSVSDILRTRGNTLISYGEGFSQEYFRISNPQMVKINFSYRFGKMDMNMFKRNRNQDSMNMMQMQ